MQERVAIIHPIKGRWYIYPGKEGLGKNSSQKDRDENKYPTVFLKKKPTTASGF